MGSNRHHEGNGDSRRYRDWMRRSYEDKRAAELLIHNEDTLDAATFHCQQCIEKALKGYILYKTGTPVDGHNLTWLCRQAIKQDARFQEWLDESAALNRYYIETRYPSDTPFELDDRRVAKVYGMARAMYDFILSEISENN